MSGFYDEQTKRKFPTLSSMVSLCLLVATLVCGSALAAPADSVAVAEAAVWAAQNGRPVLPADRFQAPLPPTPLTAEELQAIEDQGNTVTLGEPEVVETHDHDQKLADLYRKLELQIADATEAKLAQSNPPVISQPPIVQNNDVYEMKIEYPKTAVLSEDLPAQLVIGVLEKGCAPCKRLEADIIQVLTPLGWTIGNGNDNQIVFRTMPGVDALFPFIVLYQNGRQIQTWEGYTAPAVLSNALRKAWDSADKPLYGAAPVGAAGVIKGKSQIESALSQWKDKIGENVVASFIWDRSGAQSLPLLAKGEWTAPAIFGNTGHFDLAAKGAVNVPIDEVGFGYRIQGDDVLIDADPVKIDGMAKWLSPGANKSQSLYGELGAGPNKIFIADDIVLAWGLFSAGRGILSLLWPSVDLDLPGQISATAVMKDGVLTVDFQKGPTVKLVFLFAFRLVVKRVDISPHNIHVEFTGSRLVKSRDFKVE